MAWTDPAGHIWATAETVTAANMNTYIRLNLEETAPDKVTTAGDTVYATGANALTRLAIGAANSHLVSTGTAPVWRAITTDVDTGNGTTSSTGYLTMANLSDTPLAGEVEVTVTTGTEALVLWKGLIENTTAGSSTSMSYSVSGATTVAANDIHRLAFESSANDDKAEFDTHDLRTGLTAGSNVFTLEGRVSAGVGKFTRPEITVIAF